MKERTARSLCGLPVLQGIWRNITRSLVEKSRLIPVPVTMNHLQFNLPANYAEIFLINLYFSFEKLVYLEKIH